MVMGPRRVAFITWPNVNFMDSQLTACLILRQFDPTECRLGPVA